MYFGQEGLLYLSLGCVADVELLYYISYTYDIVQRFPFGPYISKWRIVSFVCSLQLMLCGFPDIASNFVFNSNQRCRPFGSQRQPSAL